MTPEVAVTYAESDQHNVVVGREPDLGSSCCALSAANTALFGLMTEQSLSLAVVQGKLPGWVQEWDDRGQNSGCEPLVVLKEVAKSMEVKTSVDVEEAVLRTEESLVEILNKPSSFALILTAVPLTTERDAEITGDTFSIVVRESGLYLFDTHHHELGIPGNCGTIRAAVAGHGTESAQAMAKFVFKRVPNSATVARGLLQQLRCREDILDVTVFHLQDPPSAQHQPSVLRAFLLAKVASSSVPAPHCGPDALPRRSSSRDAHWPGEPAPKRPKIVGDASPDEMQGVRVAYYCPSCSLL